jgi:hypothetical protein
LDLSLFHIKIQDHHHLTSNTKFWQYRHIRFARITKENLFENLNKTLANMDGELKTGGQNNRTKIEQNYIENMIQKLYDQYTANQKVDDDFEDEDKEEDASKKLTPILARDHHAQYLYLHLESVGKLSGLNL